ncbi:hypothetical protein KGM_203079 [Danaus plexippus plexippus]|uniref:Uncharacterized protein n=1 Tax=Danaus plexippus plexippus TaxID=278856 RepID=A0A212F7I5_DANPL|nr:hypothetical protein KGM_203079 [Danaus plexippus plexippus]
MVVLEMLYCNLSPEGIESRTRREVSAGAQGRNGHNNQLIACGRRRSGPPQPSRSHNERDFNGALKILGVETIKPVRLYVMGEILSRYCSNAGFIKAGALEGGPLGGGGGGGGGALRAAGLPPTPSLGASRHSLIGFQVCPEQIDELCSGRGDIRGNS